MAVDEPLDVLQELVELAGGYVGPEPWILRLGSRRSNPVKLDNRSLKSVTAHPDPRHDLTARAGVALLYALRSQGLPAEAGTRFSREFRHRDGRRLSLENGVLRDLLAAGAVSGGKLEDLLMLTGLGAERLSDYFPQARD